MTREEAINILIAVAVCSTEYLYCDEYCPLYNPRNMKNGCNVWNDELVKEAVETISSLRQQDVPDTDVGKNEPLTLDELLKMDGEPVWVVWPDGRIKSQWFIISSTFWIEMFQEWDGTLSKDYGKTWLAYRQKPEEGAV